MKPTLNDVQRLAAQAGQILRAGYAQDFRVDFKGTIDLVTEVDHRSEDFLLGEIKRAFPGHSVLAEESGALGAAGGDLWIVDPLDGTVNYAHGIPIFSVSVAYAQAGVVQLGAVYDPMRDEMFSAERGAGSWLNGKPVRASGQTTLERSLLVTGFAYDIWETGVNLDQFGRLSRMTQGVRRLGSAALDLCYVASGRFDGYWEYAVRPWDIAAGGLVAEEAGARVTAVDGQPDYITPQSILAAPPEVHAKILSVLDEFRK
jgi:myo-inositol-1(or 4)-monophosphatase